MRIQLVEVTLDQAGALLVTFHSALGVARARWVSETQPPLVGKAYDVELDIDASIDRTTNARNVEGDGACLFTEGDHTLLRGSVEAVEDDGLAYLRLATDCLVMIDTAGNISRGEVIEISLPSISFSVTVVGVG